MLLFLPVGILVLSLLALSASNLQRGFRSNWILALSGASLAWLSLLFLRLQLPLELSLPVWWAGEGLEYPATFILDQVSWPLAFAACSLLVASLLTRVREAMSAPWFSWAPSLAVTAGGLLAISAGDPLTFLFTWTLLDLLVFARLLSQPRGAEQQLAVLQKIPISLLSTVLLFAAWLLAFYGQALTSVLIFISATLRLGLLTPNLRWGTSIAADQNATTILLLIPLAPSLVLLARTNALAEPLRSSLLLLILLPAAYAAAKWFLTTGDGENDFWNIGMASLVAGAALSGQAQAAVAFALALLLGRGLIPFVQQFQRARLLPAAAAMCLLSGFPLTATYQGGAIYTNWGSTFVFAFLAVQAAMLAGWLRHALQHPPEPLQPEPWMRTIQWLGIVLLPLVFIFFGFGLLPSFVQDAASIPLWPAIVVLAGLAIFFIIARWLRPKPAPRVQLALDWIFSLRWLLVIGALFSRALSWLLSFLSSLLEGQAGVLWALLFVAILLSLAAQYGLGS